MESPAKHAMVRGLDGAGMEMILNQTDWENIANTAKLLVRRAMVIMITLSICLSFSSPAKAQDSKLIVVATDAAYEDAHQWVDYLTSKEVPTQHITPLEFSEYKEEKYIAVIVGINESDDIVDIAGEVLNKEEMEWVSQPGRYEMYYKSDVWIKGQEIIVFAGSDKEDAALALEYKEDKWLLWITAWFDIELSHEELYGY